MDLEAESWQLCQSRSENEDAMRILEVGPGQSLKLQHRENREERTLKGGRDTNTNGRKAERGPENQNLGAGHRQEERKMDGGHVTDINRSSEGGR